MNDFPMIADLIPHREPMVLLDRMLGWSPGFVECAMQVRRGARFVEDGLLLAPFTIEHMAQAVAVCLGYEAYRSGQGVRAGMIVSCREFQAQMESVSVGDELMIRANRERGNEALSHFRCEVSREGEAFANTSLAIVHSEAIFQSGFKVPRS